LRFDVTCDACDVRNSGVAMKAVHTRRFHQIEIADIEG